MLVISFIFGYEMCALNRSLLKQNLLGCKQDLMIHMYDFIRVVQEILQEWKIRGDLNRALSFIHF